jgi:hypothetical protein
VLCTLNIGCSSLQNGQTQSTTRAADNVKVQTTNVNLELLGNLGTVGINGRLAGCQLQTDVGQLTKVSAGSGVHSLGLEGKAVDVVASLLGDSNEKVPGLDEGEIIAAHFEQTISVFVQQTGQSNWVATSFTVSNKVRADTTSCVIRPFASLVTARRVANCGIGNVPEQSLDAVGETNVISGVRQTNLGSVKGATTSALDLFDNHITRAFTHLDTFFVRDNGIIGPQLNVGQIDRAGGGNQIVGSRTTVKDQQFGPVAEFKVNAHFIVRQGSCWQSNTSVTSEEIRQRNVDGVGRERVGGLGQIVDFTNHIVITSTFALSDGKGRPHIEPIAIKLLNLEVVKGDPGKIDQIVTNVPAPTDTRGNWERGAGGGEADRNSWQSGTEPNVQQIVTSTGNLECNITIKVGVTSILGQGYWHLGEPSSLADATHEIGYGGGTIVQIFFNFIKSSEIDKRTCYSIRHD